MFDKIYKIDGEPVGDGIQQSNYIKIDNLSKNSMVDVQVALSLQSNQENEKRETDFVIVQTPFSKSIISDNLSDIFFRVRN